MYSNWKDTTKLASAYNPSIECCYESTVVPYGNTQNRQRLRKINGDWELQINVNFVHIILPIQEQQAQILLKGDIGHTFHTRIRETEFYTFDDEGLNESI